ncbi:MAG: C40 family peptidase [Gemmatimonadales bacterium]
MSRSALLGLLLLTFGATPVAGQGFGIQVGKLFNGPNAESYRLGSTGTLAGPVGFGLHGALIDQEAPLGSLWGGGVDLSVFRGGRKGLYLVGGLEGGIATYGDTRFWGSWSMGGGYELFPLRGFSLALEGRYREVGPGSRNAIELGVRFGLDRGTRRSATGGGRPAGDRSDSPPSVEPDTEAIRTELGRAGVSKDRAALLSGVVQTALDVMGMPYRWGDQGEEGFDCSGLIRYAFGKHGVVLPRRSVEQAREGSPVEKNLGLLRAGDVLTFATSGSRVSHVGLYLGNGRFIHSARGGVQISTLNPDDITGRWWWKRWLGARRIVS